MCVSRKWFIVWRIAWLTGVVVVLGTPQGWGGNRVGSNSGLVLSTTPHTPSPEFMPGERIEGYRIARDPVEPALVPVHRPHAFSRSLSPTLADVYIDDRRSRIDETLASLFERIRVILFRKQDWVLQIEGYCDQRGSASYAMALSQRRMSGIREYLIALGVHPAKVSVVNYGAETPACQANSSECWEERLRRTHVFRLVSIGESRRGCLARLRVIGMPLRLRQAFFDDPPLRSHQQIWLATKPNGPRGLD